jgi:hypothetical protein
MDLWCMTKQVQRDKFQVCILLALATVAPVPHIRGRKQLHLLTCIAIIWPAGRPDGRIRFAGQLGWLERLEIDR